MISNKNFIIYKDLDLVELYNFDIKFVFIWLHLKKKWIYLCCNYFKDSWLGNRIWKSLIFRDGWHKQPSLKIAFSETVLLTEPPLKMDSFLEADFLMEPPLKLISSNGCIATVPPAKVSDGVLRQPLLLEKRSASKNHFYTNGCQHQIWVFFDAVVPQQQPKFLNFGSCSTLVLLRLTSTTPLMLFRDRLEARNGSHSY